MLGVVCVCVHIGMYTCVCDFMCLCVQKHMLVRGHCWVYYSITSLPYSQRTWSTDLANWLASKPQGFFCVHLPTSKLFYMGSGNQTWVLLLTQWRLYWASPSARIVSFFFFQQVSLLQVNNTGYEIMSLIFLCCSTSKPIALS